MEVKIQATREHTISCGHRVQGHESKCANFHGHNYTIHITIEGVLDDVGRVLDFAVMKSLFVAWLEQAWDHKFLLWEHDQYANAGLQDTLPGFVLVPFNPTAENMAEFLLTTQFPRILDLAGVLGVRVTKVLIYETPKCSASASL